MPLIEIDADMTSRMLKARARELDYGSIKAQQIEERVAAAPGWLILGHARWMCDQALGFLDHGNTAKAVRWLHFINGVMFGAGMLSVFQIQRENVPAVILPSSGEAGPSV